MRDMIFGILNIFTLVLVSDLKLVIRLVNQDKWDVVFLHQSVLA